MTFRSQGVFTYTLFLLIPLSIACLGGYLVSRHSLHQQHQQNLEDQLSLLDSQIATTADQLSRLILQRTADQTLRLLTELHGQYAQGILSLAEAQEAALISPLKPHGVQLLFFNAQGQLFPPSPPSSTKARQPADPLLKLMHTSNQTGLISLPSPDPRNQSSTVYTFSKQPFTPWQWTVIAIRPMGPQLLRQALTILYPHKQDAAIPFLIQKNSIIFPLELHPLLPQTVQQHLQTGENSLWNTPLDLGFGTQHYSTQVQLRDDASSSVGFFLPVDARKQTLAAPTRAFAFLSIASFLLALLLAALHHHYATHRWQQLMQTLETGMTGQALADAKWNSPQEFRRIINRYQELHSQQRNLQQQLTIAQQNSERTQANLRREIVNKQDMQQKLRAEINARKSAETYLQLFKNVFDNAIEGIYITDDQARILAVNPSFEHITGYQAPEVLGQNPKILQSGKQGHDFYRHMWDTLRRKGAWSGEIWNKKKNGALCPHWLSISQIKNELQQTTHYFAFLHDISDLKQKERQISIMAYTDALTKLPNRAALELRLTKALAKASREQKNVAVFFIDLDNFKNINDALGHDKGDEVLIEVATRLQHTIRTEDTLVRLGGDEFILLSEQMENHQMPFHLATRLLQALRDPIDLGASMAHVHASIGIAIYPEDGITGLELIKNADMAMYKAKSEGKNTFALFTHEMHETLWQRMKQEEAMRAGLKHKEFTVFYQPKIAMANERTTSLEALIRWQKDGQLIGPDDFIPLAEESGLIEEMSFFVLSEVCQFIVHLQHEQVPVVPISINISPRLLHHHSLVETVDTLLEQHRIDHRYIEFEITESTAMHNVEHTLEIMHNFRQRGITFSIDDFGTGYSSLSHLNSMPVSTLKIDKQFIDLENQSSKSIVATIAAMSREMELKVVAEGVETQQQMEWLRSIGCDEIQGFFYSHPLSDQDTMHYLRQSMAS